MHVALTNTVENALGNVTITKKATGDFPDLTDPVYATVQIPFTYSYTIPGQSPVTGQTFVLNQANNFTVTSQDYPTGTRVTVTEGTPTGVPPNLSMDFEGWSGTGVTSVGQTATLTIGDGTTVAAVITNSTIEELGTFQVTKQFCGRVDPDDPILAPVDRHDHLDGPGRPDRHHRSDPGQQLDRRPDRRRRRPGHVPARHRDHPGGDRHQRGATERGPHAHRLGSGRPQRPDQGPGHHLQRHRGGVRNAGERGQLRHRHLRHPQGAVRRRRLRARRSGTRQDVQFLVVARWAAQPDIGQTAGVAFLLMNQANGWSTALGQSLKVGTVVTLSEPTVFGLPPDVGWDGEPAWGDGVTTNRDGTATLTITDSEQEPDIALTNTLTKLTGTFGVAKEVSGDFDFDSPGARRGDVHRARVLARRRPVRRPGRPTWCWMRATPSPQPIRNNWPPARW